ncbi:LysR family transcriptional regulator [Thiomicrospira cyclica]|uniref:Transcriptional regulator, LysR family n=1 Tax=Thiomicrospira cyclica (strain DSM 14477 / JCM 11371 / ALM1) TaxID=717773 RepID=F6DBN1_THICA|nr:LysR family transcriptional regulator [Thiomicrospira cyclica]AEG32433.1 transcriptional regulator, LysR family [Thiomicrospira cyclica ALM1]
MAQRHDSLEGLSIFVQVIESGSFSGAANELGHAVSHISKSISRLEARLGVRLIQRTTRSLRLTEAGKTYYEKARQIVNEARDAELSLTQHNLKPSGRLKISLPNSFGQSHLQPLITQFALSYPDIQLQIDFSSRLVDLVGEGYDLAIRMGQLKDSNMISRKLLDYGFYTVATPEFLARHGTPQHPHDLKDCPSIKYTYNQVPLTWDYINEAGKKFHVEPKHRVECNNMPMQKTLVMANIGIARLPSFSCLEEIAQGHLVRLLKNYETPKQSATLVYPNKQHLNTSVRHFIEMTMDYFQSQKD